MSYRQTCEVCDHFKRSYKFLYACKLYNDRQRGIVSCNIDEAIRSVLNAFFFFCDKISQAQKSIKNNTRH